MNFSNLGADLSELEGILAFVGTIQGVIIAGLPVGEAQHIASGVFRAAAIIRLCTQKAIEALHK